MQGKDQEMAHVMKHDKEMAARPIVVPEPAVMKSEGEHVKRISDLLRAVGQYYGTDPVTIRKFMDMATKSRHAQTGSIRALEKVVEDINQKKNPEDKRVFCKDCFSMGEDQSCACAKSGAFGAHLARFRPAPYVPRTCHEFFPAFPPAALPLPPGRIRIIQKEASLSESYGYHPNDERWIKETISQKIPGDKDFDEMIEKYKAVFREFYNNENAPEHGKEGYARRHSNIWLRKELTSLDSKVNDFSGIEM